MLFMTASPVMRRTIIRFKTARDEFSNFHTVVRLFWFPYLPSTSGRKHHYGLTSGVEGDRIRTLADVSYVSAMR